MKNTEIIISNNGSEIKFNLESSNGKSTYKVQKALVYRFMDYYDTLRAVRSKSFKGNEPFVVQMKINGVLIYDTRWSIEAQLSLKLVNNPKGRVRFMENLSHAIGLAIRLQKTNVEEVIEDTEERLFVSESGEVLKADLKY